MERKRPQSSIDSERDNSSSKRARVELQSPNKARSDTLTTWKPLHTLQKEISPPAFKKPRGSSSAVAGDRKAEPLLPKHIGGAPAKFATRLALLQHLHAQYKRLNSDSPLKQKEAGIPKLTEQELVEIAIGEESRFAIENPAMYTNLVKLRIGALKKVTVDIWIKQRKEKLQPEPEPDQPSNADTGLSFNEELAILPRLQASQELLEKAGFITKKPSEQEITSAKEGVKAAHGWEVCDRCRSRFQVFPGRNDDGKLASGGSCTFHPGKINYPPKEARSRMEKTYTCCSESIGASSGCTTAEHHVFKAPVSNRLAAVLQFELTPNNNSGDVLDALCLDCEMCYTTMGMELVRLTATSWPQTGVLLDFLVRPIGEIIDFNTRYSGVSAAAFVAAHRFEESDDPKILQGAQLPETASKLVLVPGPKKAREILFRLMSPRTLLIGHALENDVHACRIIHTRIVDTALLFPHRAGLPYKLSLKALTKEFLDRVIQQDNGTGQGHDSAEDASAAGDLVRFRVGKEWKLLQRGGWKLQNEKFIPPDGPMTG